MEIVRMGVQVEDRRPVNREDTPNHIREDQGECSYDDLEVE